MVSESLYFQIYRHHYLSSTQAPECKELLVEAAGVEPASEKAYRKENSMLSRFDWSRRLRLETTRCAAGQPDDLALRMQAET